MARRRKERNERTKEGGLRVCGDYDAKTVCGNTIHDVILRGEATQARCTSAGAGAGENTVVYNHNPQDSLD